MLKYLTKFASHSNYETFKSSSDYITPNVSLCLQQNEVHYNPFVETRVICKYNVTSTSSPTALRTSYDQNIFKSMEIDGVMLDELVTEYTFDTTGVHTVKYELYDDTKLGNSAPTFYNGNLIEVTIPNSVTSIGMNAFNNCTSLSSCTIGNGVTSIGESAFVNCSGLTSIDIPNSVTSIGSNAFYNCSGLKTLSYNAQIGIDNNAFANHTSLTSVIIGNSVTSIGNGAFHHCSSLTSVIIGSGVTSIGDGAFYYCSSLTSVIIGNSVTSIGDGTFKSCTSLSSITSNATTAPTIQNNTFQDVKINGTLTVPNGSSGYDTWMQNSNYYLGLYNWTKVEQ